MKRVLLCSLVIVMLLSTTALAATDAQINTADALYELGLFLGTDKGYELDSSLTRAQGITLLVRMTGNEPEAMANNYLTRFTDVPEWAAGYVGYAYANGITYGRSDTEFDPHGTMTDYMFLTLVLRALGYSDSGDAPQFVWDKPYALACELGLVESTAADENFTRGDAVTVFWNALDAQRNEGQITLAQQLIQQGVFTKTELEKACIIQIGEKLDATTSRPAGNGGSIRDETNEDDNDGSAGDENNGTGDGGSNAEDTTPPAPNQTPWG